MLAYAIEERGLLEKGKLEFYEPISITNNKKVNGKEKLSVTVPMMMDEEIPSFNCQEAIFRVKKFVNSESDEEYAVGTDQLAPLEGAESSHTNSQLHSGQNLHAPTEAERGEGGRRC
jgi:hypothetical protein